MLESFSLDALIFKLMLWRQVAMFVSKVLRLLKILELAQPSFLAGAGAASDEFSLAKFSNRFEIG